MKKITFIDIMIVVVIIGVIVGGFYYLSSKNIIQTSGDADAITFDFCVSGLEENIADEINVGDVVYDSAKKIELGKITDVTKTKEEDVYPDNVNGGYHKKVVDNRYRVIFTVSTEKASYEDNILKVNNYEVYLGKSCYVKGQNFALSAVVWRIDGINDDGGIAK